MNTPLKPADSMPGSFGLPIIGEGLDMAFGYGWELERKYQKYGAVFKTSLLGKKYAVLIGSEANKLILQDKADRVYNPVGVILFRGVVKEIEYAGYLIPPGWGIILSQALTHKLPTLYTNPEKFDPARFAPPREEDKKDPYGLIGFGGGAHMCIGMEFGKMEMKIFLSKLLKKYNWSVSPSYTDISPILFPPRFESKFRAFFRLRR